MKMIGEYTLIQMKISGILKYHLTGIFIRLSMNLNVENTKTLFIPNIFPAAPLPSYHGYYDIYQFLHNKRYVNILTVLS